MMAYGLIWWMTATLLAAVGAAVATVSWSIPTILLIFVCAALCATAINYVAQDEDVTGRRQTPVITTNVLLSGGGAVALFGLGAMLGALVITVVVVALSR